MMIVHFLANIKEENKLDQNLDALIYFYITYDSMLKIEIPLRRGGQQMPAINDN